jgi:hypothetical protein
MAGIFRRWGKADIADGHRHTLLIDCRSGWQLAE